MTAPRPIFAGTTYLITRRCLNRMLLLRPCAVVTQTFAFVLARAAKRTGVQVHAFCVMSNHYHLVVTDPQARLPEFTQYLDAFVARATNSLVGRREQFWGGHSYSAVALGSPADVISKVAYTLANPVAAGLVKAGHLWPGLWSKPATFGSATRVRRPDQFFDKKGLQPECEELELVVPVGFRSTADFRAQVEAELTRQELAAQEQKKAFLGAERVLKQGPFTRPKSAERHGGLSPRVATRDRWRRIEMLGRLKSFLADYAEALRTWREGKEEPIFPAGTYLMRVAHGVACAQSV
jgi:putative transposase